jgi:hypothetical protein
MDLSLEELMNLEITPRQRRDRHGFIGGPDDHIIVSAERVAPIWLWRGEAESKGRRASSQLRISAASRQGTALAPSLHPGSSAICRIFKLFAHFVRRGSHGRTPIQRHPSGIKTSAQSPPLDCARPRVSTWIKSIDSDSRACCGREVGMLQSRSARTAQPSIGITRQNCH